MDRPLTLTLPADVQDDPHVTVAAERLARLMMAHGPTSRLVQLVQRDLQQRIALSRSRIDPMPGALYAANAAWPGQPLSGAQSIVAMGHLLAETRAAAKAAKDADAPAGGGQ